MTTEMSRAQRVEVCHGALASLLLPMISQDPYNAYSNALHKKIVADHGENFASKSDVTRTMKLLVENGLATEVKEDPDRHESRVFYFPTFMAGILLGLKHPQDQWSELDLLLDRPAKAKAA